MPIITIYIYAYTYCTYLYIVHMIYTYSTVIIVRFPFVDGQQPVDAAQVVQHPPAAEAHPDHHWYQGRGSVHGGHGSGEKELCLGHRFYENPIPLI
jgi:hypothetical protein